MDAFYVEKLLGEYPYLKDSAKYTLFVSEEEYSSLKQGPKVFLDSESLSIDFLKKILTDDRYYSYALKFFCDEINSFVVSFIVMGDTGGHIGYSKTSIIKGIDYLIEKMGISFSNKQMERFKVLKRISSFDSFLKDNNDKFFAISIDGNEYNIPIKQIIDLMQMPDEEFDEICLNDEITEINGIKKEYFIYAAYTFFNSRRILYKYVTPEGISKRMQSIASLQKIDIQAINKHLVNTDIKHLTVRIDEELRHAILSSMPNDLTDLEKAIYIYIKMCKVLTYDDEYYALNQKGLASAKHRFVEHVSEINLQDNRVVCYEFNIIYAKLLSELGIIFKTNYLNMVGEAYGEVHANLEFRVKKFLVMADSVTSIFNGDISSTKTNQPLQGLKCLNKNMKTRQEFKSIVSKIYDLVIFQENNNHDAKSGHIPNLEDLLKDYLQLTDIIYDVDLYERLNILIEKTNSLGLVGIDAFSYIIQLKRLLFTDEQHKNNFRYSVICKNLKYDETKTALSCAIFTLNREGFKVNPEGSIYFYYEPGQPLKPMTKEELQASFDSGLFNYVDSDDRKIPGIVEKGEMKRC